MAQLHPADYISDFLQQRKAKNASYSVRAFARDLNVSPAYLSLVLSKKKLLSISKAIQIGQILKLNPKEAKEFFQAAMECNPKQYNKEYEEQSAVLYHDLLADQQNPNQDDVDTYLLELDRFQLVSQWYHFAILDLFTCIQTVSQVEWVSDVLNVPVPQVREAVDRLFRLGLLEEKNGCWSKTKNKIYVPTEKFETAIRDFHREIISKASEELNKTSEKDWDRRSISGMTLAVNPSQLKEAYLEIEKFQKRMSRLLTQGPCQDVYALHVQLFPLSEIRNVKK